MIVDVIGLYPVEGTAEPCHLVEILVHEFHGNIDLTDFTQDVPGQNKDTWQVPYDEYLLNEDGTSGELAPFPGPLQIGGKQRLAFFFHYIDLNKPLLTPTGFVKFPEPSPCPDRLSFISYESPD